MMLQFIIDQLLPYHLLVWCGFIAIAFVAAKQWLLLGIIGGQLVIAVTIAVMDIRWIQAEMRAPAWNPLDGPDMDVVFIIGVLLRVVLVVAVLLPVNALGVMTRRRQKESHEADGQLPADGSRPDLPTDDWAASIHRTLRTRQTALSRISERNHRLRISDPAMDNRAHRRAGHP